MNEEPETAPWNDGVRGTQVLPLINSDELYIRVEAGPGTGKTFGLQRRVVRLVHPTGRNAQSHRVLVVAFNRVIASDLRGEIRAALQHYDLIEKVPWISTVHGLCLEILGNSIRLLLPHERDAMLYDVQRIEPRLADEFSRHDNFEQALHDHEAGHREHPLLWQTVQAWLNRHKVELISDLPGKLLASIKGGDHSDARFDHIVVDEFQDLTETQHQLIVALLAHNGALTVLGDRRQSIYKFLGNDPEGLARLENLVGSAVFDIPMTECQRCPEDIVQAANQLMVSSHATPMTPASVAPTNTHLVVWGSPQAEADGMAKAILQNMTNYPADRHLVMVTRRQFGYMLRDAIHRLKPEQELDLRFDEGLLNSWGAREAFLFLCLSLDPDPATWRAWFAYKVSLTGDDFLAAGRNAEAYLNFMKACDDQITAETVKGLMDGSLVTGGTGVGNLKERAERFSDLLGHVAIDLEAPVTTVQSILNPALWVTDSYIKERESAERDLDLLTKATFSTLDEQINLGKVGTSVLKEVIRSLRGQVATRDVACIDTPNALRVTTLWSAKGVTADHVYVLGLCDEAIPGKYKSQYPGTEAEYFDEQRRLFFVTLTRSKGTLVLSRPRTVQSGEGMRLGLAVHGSGIITLKMSRFLRDIISKLPTAAQGQQWPGL